MDACRQGARRLRECIVDGLNVLFVIKMQGCKNEEGNRRTRSGVSGKVLKAWDHILRNGRR